MLKHAPAKLGLVVVLVAGLVVSGLALAASLRLEESVVIPQDTTSRAIQETIWFQGYLANSATGDPINASYNIVARIYSLSAGGAVLWGPETHNSVTITQGWFNIELGSVTPFGIAFDSPPYYLALNVNGENLTPRLKLASVPSAFQSSGADDLTLSYYGTYSGADDAFTIENTSTSSEECIQVFRTGTSDPGARGIAAYLNGPGEALYAEQHGTTGHAGGFWTFDGTNSEPVVESMTFGTGVAYYGSTAGTSAGEFYAAGAGGHVVHAECTGTGSSSVAVYGQGIPEDSWGYGGYFVGGGTGVYGTASGTVDDAYVGAYGTAYGNNTGATSYGLYGYAGGDGANYGIYASASGGTSNYAGWFDGNVFADGYYSTPMAGFQIDDPENPESQYFRHSYVASSEAKDVYDGVATLDGAGEVWVELPEWFETLNQDFRYQLTAIGVPAPGLYIGEKVTGNRFMIAGGEPGMEVSWQVTGVRHDKFAEANTIPVIQAKPAAEQGKYMHPELYGQPETMSVSYNERMAKQAEGSRAIEKAVPERQRASGTSEHDSAKR